MNRLVNVADPVFFVLFCFFICFTSLKSVVKNHIFTALTFALGMTNCYAVL